MSGFSALEYEGLAVVGQLPQGDPNAPVLTDGEVDELYALGKRMRQRIIEHTGRSKVRFRQFVGLVRVGGRDIEVLPKIETPGEPLGIASVRGNLLAMLLAAYDVEVHLPGEAQAVLAKSSWLDAFILMFCRNLGEQARRGLTKRYRVDEDDLQMVRGRILVDEQVRRNFVHKERLACEFDELDEDHELNQLLKLALTRMLRLARSAETQRHVRELLLSFGAVSIRTSQGAWWRGVKLNRLAARFEPSKKMAQLFISKMSPDVAKGGKSSFSLLFDMNLLFEEYVGRQLRKELAAHGLSVSLQHSQHHLMQSEDGEVSMFRLKPDIVVAGAGVTYCIADTKYKRLQLEERKLGVAQADLYQMLGYAHRYHCERLLMLYPYEQAAKVPLDEGRLLRYQARNTTVVVGQICLADLGKVRQQLRLLYRRAVGLASLEAIEPT